MKYGWLGFVVLLALGFTGSANACDCDSMSCPRPDGLPLGYTEVSGWEPLSCQMSISEDSFWITFGGTSVGCKAVCKNCSNSSTSKIGAGKSCDNTYGEKMVVDVQCPDTILSGIDPPLFQQSGGVYLPGGGGFEDVECEAGPCEGIEVYRNKIETTFHFEFEIVRKKRSYWGPLGAGFTHPPGGLPGPDWEQKDCITTNSTYLTQASALISGEHQKNICDDPDVVLQCAMGGCNTND